MLDKTTTPIDDFGRDYLRLVLEIEKHIEGYIDAYFGPPDLQQQVAVAERKAPSALLAEMALLQERIPEHDPGRAAYLSATLRAIECTLRILNGENFDYLEKVRCIFDISPGMVDEAVFNAAHDELERLLPGAGGLAERVAARRKRYELADDQALAMLELARMEAWQRTAALFDLLDGESVELRLTHDQPWGAYNWYLGNARSLVEFNTDQPLVALDLISVMAHEAYPGHHTELQLKEQHLYRARGYAENCCTLLHSPWSVIAEGIATTAIEIIFDRRMPGGDQHDWNEKVLLSAANLTGETAEHMRALHEAARPLRYVDGHAAVLYHSGQLDEAQTIDYIQSYRLVPAERARRSFRFLSHPLFGPYVFTYTHGYDLIEQAAADGNKKPIFARLLMEQVLPSQLASGDWPPPQ